MSKRTSEDRRADLAAVRGSMGITRNASMAVVPLSDVRPSVSRSDELSGDLIVRGVDSRRIAEELELALGATMQVHRPVTVCGKYSHHEDVDVPDWKTRMVAIEKIIKVRGWEFDVERLQEGSVSRDILMVVRNLTINGRKLGEASIEELTERHRADVEAGLIGEAEVVDTE
jgi:hypothetical protein